MGSHELFCEEPVVRKCCSQQRYVPQATTTTRDEEEGEEAESFNLTASVEAFPYMLGSSTTTTATRKRPISERQQRPPSSYELAPAVAMGSEEERRRSSSSSDGRIESFVKSFRRRKSGTKNVSNVIRRVKNAVGDLWRDRSASWRNELDDGAGQLNEALLRRIRRVWVDVDMLPHQAEYYSLLLKEFQRQIREDDIIQTLVQMISYLRVAANAVEMLPEKLLLQLHQYASHDPGANSINLRSILKKLLFEDGDVRCALCNDPQRPDVQLAPCGHLYHNNCLTRWLATAHRQVCFTCRTNIKQIIDATLLDGALRQAANLHLRRCDINKNVPWVLSNKYQKIIECIDYEIRQARRKRALIRFVVVSSFPAMIEGFARTLSACTKVPYDVITPVVGKLKVHSIVKRFGAALEPRILIYHADALNPKHDLGSTTHIYFMDPWKDSPAQRTVLACVLNTSGVGGHKVLVADFISTYSIEAEALQVDEVFENPFQLLIGHSNLS